MTVFLIFVSFVFPPLGFTADNVNATDIPEFNATENQFDYLQDPANTPGEPNRGTLQYEQGADQYEDSRNRSIAEYFYLTTRNTQTPENPSITVGLVNNSVLGMPTDTETITVGETVSISNWSYAVSFTNLQFQSDNTSYSVEWEVHERPDTDDDGSWIDSIPIVGGLVSAGSGLVSAVLWIGSVLATVITNAILGVTNVFITLFNVLGFFFTFMFWLLSTYGAIVGGAPNTWVSVFMAIPGIVLSFEFGKLVIILLQTILRGIPLT